MTTRGVLGIDMGATLCKLALRRETLVTEHWPARDLDAVAARVRALAPGRIVVTGGGADRLGAALAGLALEQVGEFDAWARGAGVLAAEEGRPLPASYLLVSLGTGTSVLAVTADGVQRVGGTALGGGTLVGLGRLLLATDSFATLAALAAGGDRARVDLVLADVYPATASTEAGQLTAAAFAKLASTAPADVAHALLGLVGENVALLAAAHARGARTQTIVYCGSPLAESLLLRAIVDDFTRLAGGEAIFLT